MIRILMLLILLNSQSWAAPLFQPQDPEIPFQLLELERLGLDAWRGDSTDQVAARLSLANGGQWLEGGATLVLNPHLQASFWISGSSVEQGEHLLGTHTTRGGWTGRVTHGTLVGDWRNVELELGRRSLDQGFDMISELGWSRELPAVDMLRYRLKTNGGNLTLDVINGQLSSEDSATLKRWYASHRLTWRLPRDRRNFICLGDHAIFAGEQRGLEWLQLSPFSPFFLENFEGYSEADNDQTIDADNSSMFLAWNWWSRTRLPVRHYGELLVDEFQLDSQDRKKLDDALGLTLGLELDLDEWAGHHTRLRLESSWLSHWTYVHRGEGTSFTERGHVIGNAEGADIMEVHAQLRLSHRSWGQFALGSGHLRKGAISAFDEWNAEESAGKSWPYKPVLSSWPCTLNWTRDLGKSSQLSGRLLWNAGMDQLEFRLALSLFRTGPFLPESY